MSGSESEARTLLADGLAELGLGSSGQQRSALWKLAVLLENWAQRINLSGHRDLDGIVRRLVLDAAALAAELPDLPSLADIGAGAGFPAFPIAILRPGCQVTLIEARERRHHFQREVIRQLGLANAHAVLGRAESLEPERCAAAIGQAVAPPAELLPLLLPWTVDDGLLIFPGGETPSELPSDPRVRFEPSARRYQVPCGGPERTLWIGRRIAAG